MNIQLSNDVLNFLAENLKSNIRQMEGAIKKLGAVRVLTGSPITIELAKNSIADLMSGGEPVSVTIDRILDKAAKKYGVTVEDIKGAKRNKEIAHARHVSIYMIRKLTDRSLPQIGKILQRDHTTILNSLKTIEKRRANVMDVYEAVSCEEISGRKILVIDDIITTGATLSECSRTLLMAGAESVLCAALARSD